MESEMEQLRILRMDLGRCLIKYQVDQGHQTHKVEVAPDEEVVVVMITSSPVHSVSEPDTAFILPDLG